VNSGAHLALLSGRLSGIAAPWAANSDFGINSKGFAKEFGQGPET
jgi:hypothetical protein